MIVDAGKANLEIEDGVLIQCTANDATEIIIPNSVTSIDEFAFYECEPLTTINIPNSVTTIDISVFYKCESLASINIPNSVTSIGEFAFYGCKFLTSINIPNSITSIGDSIFKGCSRLTSINIPNSVTSIGNGVFNGCESLTSVTIPSSVTGIGNGIFADCSRLTSISISAYMPFSTVGLPSNNLTITRRALAFLQDIRDTGGLTGKLLRKAEKRYIRLVMLCFNRLRTEFFKEHQENKHKLAVDMPYEMIECILHFACIWFTPEVVIKMVGNGIEVTRDDVVQSYTDRREFDKEISVNSSAIQKLDDLKSPWLEDNKDFECPPEDQWDALALKK